MQYYSEEQIKQLIPNKLTKDFNKFMFGQTCGIVDGKQALYKHDVDRFLIRNNIEPLEGIDF